MYTKPISFETAERQINERLDKPTALTHREIAAVWDAEARRRAFFSARVAEAAILTRLHEVANMVISGKASKSQAVRLIQEYFVGDGADPLARMGFAPPKDAQGITELASAARLNLILDTNIKMAQECGHYRKWERLKKAFPYAQWKCGVAEEHRPEHLARDGKVYPFEHPIWTQSPPGGEFNCRCTKELLSQEDVDEMELRPEPEDSPFEPSSLGFDPSKELGAPPLGKNTPPPIAQQTMKMIQDAQEHWTDFPQGPDQLKELRPIRPLGGSTGAQLVEDKRGNRYVMKKGGSAGGDPNQHLRNECAADDFYEAAGVAVPEHRLYDTEDGTSMLTRQIDGIPVNDYLRGLTEKDRQKIMDQLQPIVQTNALLGGSEPPEIIVDAHGKVHMIHQTQNPAEDIHQRYTISHSLDNIVGLRPDLETMVTQDWDKPLQHLDKKLRDACEKKLEIIRSIIKEGTKRLDVRTQHRLNQACHKDLQNTNMPQKEKEQIIKRQHEMLRMTWQQEMMETYKTTVGKNIDTFDTIDALLDCYTSSIAAKAMPPEIMFRTKPELTSYYTDSDMRISGDAIHPDGMIYLNSDFNSWGGHPFTAFHEFGHFLDFRIVRRLGISRDGNTQEKIDEFVKLAKNDWIELQKKVPADVPWQDYYGTESWSSGQH